MEYILTYLNTHNIQYNLIPVASSEQRFNNSVSLEDFETGAYDTTRFEERMALITASQILTITIHGNTLYYNIE